MFVYTVFTKIIKYLQPENINSGNNLLIWSETPSTFAKVRSTHMHFSECLQVDWYTDWVS